MGYTVIRSEHIGKKYMICHQQGGYVTFREKLTDITKTIIRPWKWPDAFAAPVREDFWALREINFEIQRGDKVGIIGRNGAGKSTLLKVLSRITDPTCGRISIRGRVSSLLEVGTGFHPELTGRENIYLNGAILGMKKIEIKKKFDEIVAFAEIEKFLDTPVKRYSSGMYVRLAFAVAAHLEPDILIVDEVLAIGDAQFQDKCLGKMQEAGKQGRTILFVSHSMPSVSSLCEKTILLEKGIISKMGPTTDVIMHYHSRTGSSPSSVDFSRGPTKVGDDCAILLSAAVKGIDDNIITEIHIGKPFKISMQYRILKSGGSPLVPNLHLLSSTGSCAFMVMCSDAGQPSPGDYIAECQIPGNFLNDGLYSASLALRSYESGVKSHFFETSALSFNVKDPIDGTPTRSGYPGVIPGVIRPLLPWTVKRLSGMS
jgi:lipopolysaccharide transport system ATP-binding protein